MDIDVTKCDICHEVRGIFEKHGRLRFCTDCDALNPKTRKEMADLAEKDMQEFNRLRSEARP